MGAANFMENYQPTDFEDIEKKLDELIEKLPDTFQTEYFYDNANHNLSPPSSYRANGKYKLVYEDKLGGLEVLSNQLSEITFLLEDPNGSKNEEVKEYLKEISYCIEEIKNDDSHENWLKSIQSGIVSNTNNVTFVGFIHFVILALILWRVW